MPVRKGTNAEEVLHLHPSLWLRRSIPLVRGLDDDRVRRAETAPVWILLKNRGSPEHFTPAVGKATRHVEQHFG
jgi:hypothetical protein